MRRFFTPTETVASLLIAIVVGLPAGCASDDPAAAPPPDAPPPVTQPPSLATCDGNCAILDADASNTTLSVAFDRAYFGVTTDGGNQTLYLELYRGGDDGCPSEASATPAQTLIIAGLPVFANRDDLSAADGITSSLLDFAGDLTEVLAPSSATSIAIEPTAISMANPRLVAFDFDVSYENNLAAAGHVYATHCASLDATR
ncbi:MAG: hypothetical protein IPL79_08315 [Myxococcales bacterium]|nr:hypothetical protein [Myxococcales bacterium]